MAEWSGGAQWAYRQLLASLQQRGIPRDQLYVLNVDQHPELYEMPELSGRIHGWGETAVVRDKDGFRRRSRQRPEPDSGAL